MDLNSVASLRPAAAHVIIHTALVIQGDNYHVLYVSIYSFYMVMHGSRSIDGRETNRRGARCGF